MDEFKGFMKYEKQSLTELSLVERLEGHEAFQRRSSREEASIQRAGCMDCGTPFCQTGLPSGRETTGCPTGNYTPEWNDLVYHQGFKEAYGRLSGANNFPEFTGRICPAPCEQSCVMKINRDFVAIKGIERTIIDEAYDNGWVKSKYPKEHRDQNVVIIENGPTGLATTEGLSHVGYQVTVFERAAEPDGLLMYDIPNMKSDKTVVRHRIRIMREAGIIFKTNTNIGVDIIRGELEEQFDAIILCTGAQKARDLPLEGRMGQGIHFAMDRLTEQMQILNGEIEEASITTKDKNIIVIGVGDTGADCAATALRENYRSIVQFNGYTEAPEEIIFESDTSWPLALPVFKMSYAHREYEARFGREPRAYDVQAMRYDVDTMGNIRGVYTQILEETPEGMVVVDGTERYWPAGLVLLSIGSEGTETTVPRSFDIKTKQNKIVANKHDYRTNQERVFAAGDARRGQSLVVWAIKEGRVIAKSVDQYLKQKVLA